MRKLTLALLAVAALSGCAMTPEQEAGMAAALGAMAGSVALQQQRQQQQQAYYLQQLAYQRQQQQTYYVRPWVGGYRVSTY